MKRIIFFTADEVATESEKKTITALNKLASNQYMVHVRNSRIPNMHGSLEEGDLVTGSIPKEYDGNEIIDLSELPVALVSGDSVTVTSQDGSSVESISVSVKNGKVKGSLPATTTLVKNNETLPVATGDGSQISGSHRVSVGSGVVKLIKLDDSVAAIKNLDSVNILPSSGNTAISACKVDVTGSKLSGVRLPDTQAIVKSADSVSVEDSNGASAGNGAVTAEANRVKKISLDSSRAVVGNGTTVPVQNNNGTSTETATLSVNAGKIASAKLSADVAVVKNGASLSIPVTMLALLALGTAVKTVKLKIENGLITGITI